MKASATSIPAPVGGLDVEPIFPRNNVSCVAVANRHCFRYVSDAFTIGKPTSYFKNLLLCNFVKWAVFSAIMSSMPQLVFKVSRSSVIAQIVNMIVQWVAVIVATIHSIGPRSNKSQQNKIVDVKAFSFPLHVKVNVFSVYSVNSGLEYFSRLFLVWRSVFIHYQAVKTANATKVRNLVNTFIARNGFPYFLHVVAPSNAPKCKIHGSQWSDWFSGANLAMNNHYKA